MNFVWFVNNVKSIINIQYKKINKNRMINFNLLIKIQIKLINYFKKVYVDAAICIG